MTPSPTGLDLAPPRMIAIWCPDWPVVAALGSGAAAHSTAAHSAAAHSAAAHSTAAHSTAAHSSAAIAAPPGAVHSTTEVAAAVVTANHVVACSHPARTAGVRRGMRRREAQSRCPDLVVLPRDEMAEARAFEPVVAAIESIAPGVEITRPGLAAVGAHGPTRYFGGEDAVLMALSRRLGEVAVDVLIGAADGSFAAEQAARRAVVVPAGESAVFLADLAIDVVEEAELVDLLRRLGIRTLGAFAALPARDVLARFGPAGAWIHRQCGGRDARPIAARRPATEHTVDIVFEPALDRIDAVAFSARSAAERFISGLLAHGLACMCLELIAQTENGEETVRRWRQSGVLTAVDVVDRIRWQLEGWLRGTRTVATARAGEIGAGAGEIGAGGLSAESGPSSGVTLLRLVAVQCVPTGAHQQSLWAGAGAGDERAHRALARVQTLLGHGSVLSPVLDGGRDPAHRTRLVPWGDEPTAEHGPAQPWPGRLPAPAPSIIVDPPRVVQVLDAHGRVATVTARGAVPMPPAHLALGSEPAVPVTAWAGPWPVDDNWWTRPPGRDTSTAAGTGAAGTGDDRAMTTTLDPHRRARFQLVDLRGRAYLVTCSFLIAGTAVHDAGTVPAGTVPAVQWTLDAIYD